jgi:hypothetical protein
MRPSNDLSRSLLTLACDATVIAVVELSQKIGSSALSSRGSSVSATPGQPDDPRIR